MTRLLHVLLTTLIVATPAAAERLPRIVAPDHYTLWFAPDLKKETFQGRETIHVRLTQPATAITLHAAEIEFGQVRITAAGRTRDARVTLDAKAETATLTVTQPVPAGPATIEIAYTGILNDKLRGFYISEANGRKYAVSQMEATDARRAFPSFDEPSYKATFDISLMVDEGDTAISNGAQMSDTPGPEPRKHTIAFARTAKMSTYLVALLVGDFACREGSSDGTPVRVCSTPDKKALTGFALEAAEQQLKFYNDYYGIKYPFGKLDIIGIPDFAAGAMENTAAITFREQYLLADPERASLGTKKTIAAILSHEIAHQWFGDLVTMAWWDDIWLNEGFATWMANKPLAAWKPEWDVELDDVEDTQKAVALDALRSTRPIRTNVETPDEINEVFDAIAYEKSAGVLRMIEAYVGKDVFRKAVASYVRKYSYGNAKAEDFWNEVTRVAGKPVDRIMSSFVDQAGVPLLKVASKCLGASTEIHLQQERFAGSPAAPRPAQQVWTIPVCIKAFPDSPAACEVISKTNETIKAPGCAAEAFVNAGSVGYFISEYSPEAIRALSRKARGTLSPTERVGFLGDEWWMVRAARHEIGAFLDLAGALANDEVPAVLSGVATRLGFVGEYLVPDAKQTAYQAWIRARFGPALDALGFPGDKKDDEDRQERRASLVELLAVTGNSGDVQRRARQLAVDYIKDPASLPATLAPIVLRAAALAGDEALYDRYVARLKTLAADPEEFYRFEHALPYFRDAALVNRTLVFALSPDVRSQDAASLIAGVMARPWGREAAWEFVKKNWDALTDRLGTFQGIPIVASATASFCSTAAATEVKQFFAAHPVPPAERTIRQSIERIESCATLTAKQAPALSKWLDRAGGTAASR